ncbi:MAG: flagellar hook capping FlgD N-terminal domain-containing protein [Alphaproteobacteria bacterium]
MATSIASNIASATSAGVTTLSDSAKAKEAADLNFNTFLKLLTTQLQNQDPLKPMEGTDFTAQLAQFSQLEQQIKSNGNLEALVQARDYNAQTLAVSYIGKEVLAPVGSEFAPMKGALAEGGDMDFGYKLNDAVYQAKVEIRTTDGALVRTLQGGTTKGLNTLTWDGKNDDGKAVDAGNYNVQVSAIKADGTKVAHTLYNYAEVEAVAADGSDVTLNLVNGKKVSFDDVRQVRAVAIN